VRFSYFWIRCIKLFLVCSSTFGYGVENSMKQIVCVQIRDATFDVFSFMTLFGCFRIRLHNLKSHDRIWKYSVSQEKSRMAIGQMIFRVPIPFLLYPIITGHMKFFKNFIDRHFGFLLCLVAIWNFVVQIVAQASYFLLGLGFRQELLSLVAIWNCVVQIVAQVSYSFSFRV